MSIFEEQITSRVMTDEECQHIGSSYEPTMPGGLPFDKAIFALMGEWVDDYAGEWWKYNITSNDAWFMCPAGRHVYKVKDAMGTKVRMSAEGAGLAATMYLVNALAWHYHDAGMEAQYREASEHYARLLLYSRKHKDAVAIWKVLD